MTPPTLPASISRITGESASTSSPRNPTITICPIFSVSVAPAWHPAKETDGMTVRKTAERINRRIGPSHLRRNVLVCIQSFFHIDNYRKDYHIAGRNTTDCNRVRPLSLCQRKNAIPLNIVVCIKQVPDPEHFDRITLDTVTGAIRREGVPSITNPLDRHAMEEALLIKERCGGTVTAITMGPPPARKTLEDALAMGADRGAILCDPAFAGADSLATAHILAAGIRALGSFDLVLCGNESVDGATGQVTPQLAEFLNIPHITCARKITLEGEETALVERAVEGGYLRVEVSLPAAISVLKGINRYRLPTAMGIMAAADREITEMGCSVCEQIGGVPSSPTKVIEVFESSLKRQVTMLTGEPEEVTRELLHRLREMEALS